MHWHWKKPRRAAATVRGVLTVLLVSWFLATTITFHAPISVQVFSRLPYTYFDNMDALQPTFMLPPNFLFPPDGKIKPGIILEESKGLPDPQEQLHDCNIRDLQTTPLPEFRYSGDAKSNSKVGFWIDILSLIEIGLGGERGHDDNLVIQTGPAKISTFSPSKTYIAELMTDRFLAQYTKRPRCRPVYLVTGVMIAENATIEIQKGNRVAYQAKIVINGEGFGVPVKAGPEFEREASRVVGPTWTLDKPFVLGYALKKIRRSVMGATRSADYDEHALWGEGQTFTDGEEEWEVTDLVASQELSGDGNARNNDVTKTM
jgi:hypothetical protein